MSTVKVRLRPSSVDGKAGSVYYQIIHRRKTKHITTPFRVNSEDWDRENGRISGSSVSLQALQGRIDADVVLLGRIIRELDGSGREYSVSDVVSRFRSSDRHVSVLDFMRRQIVKLRYANQLGTAQNYEKALRSFSKFLDGDNIPFSAVTEQLISDYNAFLMRHGVVRNSVSFYMRILRAVYNKAVRLKMVDQTYPFSSVYTGIDRTRKRAVTEDVIASLYRMELPDNSSLALARDIFIFSYCARGMAFVDVVYLRRCDVQNGFIHYSRRKTGQLLTVRIEPVMQRIIQRYSVSESPYVFPVLKTTDIVEAYEQYRSAINSYNRMLGRLARLLPVECRLTSYTSRHSWATAARNHNVPVSVISAGMGHTSERTTRIYLSMLENTVIDDANYKIIERLCD